MKAIIDPSTITKVPKKVIEKRATLRNPCSFKHCTKEASIRVDVILRYAIVASRPREFCDDDFLNWFKTMGLMMAKAERFNEATKK